jgi:hypothetical protein
MSNRNQLVSAFTTAVLACGLCASLLAGLAVAQETVAKLPSSGKSLAEMPMQAPVENSLAYEVAQKPALESKLLSNMESLDTWELWGDRSARPRSYGTISLSKDRFHQGQASVLLTSPTKGAEPNFTSSRGRPWGSASAIYKVDSEDWTQWNRITLWAYPDLPGFRTVSFNLVLHNDNPIDPAVDSKQYGDAFVPYDSANGYHYYNLYSGLNYQLLENHQWNKVYWEIPHVRRDKVIALELRYRLQGNQREMTDTVKYYFDELYLEKVEQPEHYEGWNVAPGQIAHNHLGYLTGFPKTALSADPSAKTFQVIDVNAKQVALEKQILSRTTPQGTFQVLDFSELDRPGTYALKAGDVQTRSFRIGGFNDLYRDNLIKLINFFYCQRCGTEIPGRHSPCHSDALILHDDKSVVVNGGWHDAGDLTQNVTRTSEPVYNFFVLAERFQDSDPELSERLLEEAKWGLDWVLKTRFGDGYRVISNVSDYWTDGIIGTVDDEREITHRPARNDASANLHAARAEAKAAILLSAKDPIMADHALRCAEEDWSFAVEGIQDVDMEIAGLGLSASLSLYEATKDDKYRSAAISYGSYIVRCQQRDDLSERVPLKGFFFGGERRERMPVPRSITSSEEHAVTGLVGLLRAFPDSEHAAAWETAIRLYADYHKAMAAYTDPYSMLPAGLCDLNSAEDQIEQAKIKNGIRLDDRYYIKRFPVWTTGRGNTSVILSKAIGLAAIAKHLDDQELLSIAYRQLDWLLGLNPFNQSVMWGEGYRYQALYNPLIGNIVGAVPCGIHTKLNGDAPYWPSDTWHNPKEIWVTASSDWLWLMTHFFD